MPPNALSRHFTWTSWKKLTSKEFLKTQKFTFPQEFLKRGILGSDTIYVSVAHTKKILNKYYKVVDIIFKKLSKFKNNSDLLKNIETELCLDNLPRLN